MIMIRDMDSKFGIRWVGEADKIQLGRVLEQLQKCTWSSQGLNT